MTTAAAKHEVRALLHMAGGDAGVVKRSIRDAELRARRMGYWSEQDAEGYVSQLLALADLTGNVACRP